LREIIKKKVISVKARVVRNIKSKLARYENARLLAMSFLDTTVSFVTSLITYISDTHQMLIFVDFASDASWQLVSQFVEHIFWN